MGDTGTVSSHLFDHSMLGTKSAFKSPFFAPMLVFIQLARMVNGDSTDPHGAFKKDLLRDEGHKSSR